MEYRILYTLAPESMEELVDRYMSEGWMPQGGICVMQASSFLGFYQAIIRESKEKSDKSIGRMIQTTKGLKCSRCGDAPSIDDTRWRWNGETWAHKCGDSQARYFRAVKKESEEGK